MSTRPVSKYTGPSGVFYHCLQDKIFTLTQRKQVHCIDTITGEGVVETLYTFEDGVRKLKDLIVTNYSSKKIIRLGPL